ncbi:sensor histidine kinase [Streptomyces qinzhouensis]|uniref:histidine kinase n=1 Tax=Streptomyces qinzhouensis TaxID=2599401 RepID=A0A5B8J787_9ACTN|nr:nitrate- and nitrite sensing domain-containing protein [Streptomyces qinzhouensis]QDY75791.1 HAMP domain-containing protein [Streptomyces qinzhouensis]
MRFRGKSIRRKIVALLLVPLLSLTGLWGFTTFLTGREAARLLEVGSVVDDVGGPVTGAVRALQQERRHTLIHLADRRASGALAELREQRTAVDRALAAVRSESDDEAVRDALRADGERKLAEFVEGFDGLATLRASVDNGTVPRTRAMDYYNGLVGPAFSFLNHLHTLSDAGMDRQGRAIVGIARADEALSREDALIASALTAGRITAAELREITGLVARRELLYEINLELLPARDREVYRTLWTGPGTEPLRDTERRLVTGGPVTRATPSDAAQWQQAVAPVLDRLRLEALAAEKRHQDRVDPAAYDVFLKAGIAGVLGFLALLVSVFVSVRVGRDLVRDLSRLRREAHEVSGVRLPGVMRRLAAGEHVDVETEAPRLEYEKDEIGQAGLALNTLQRAAVEAAVRQAEMRRGVSEVFVNLARRNQVLLHRQLTLLDAMERRTEDAEELADLFRLDHLTTRMRRHAEGLVILSGAAPSRQWRKPVQLMDVVRAAVAEVEDYERIEVRRLPRIGVGGQAVADLTHLIAELLENSTVFSPPHTAVEVHGERVANGFTLEIHDRGLGMAPEVLLEANLRLAETPEFELSDTDRLGLFVISRLAQRQSVRVSLQPSPYGGTTAVVFLPAVLLTVAPDEGESASPFDRAVRAGAPGRRPATGRSGALPGAEDAPAAPADAAVQPFPGRPVLPAGPHRPGPDAHDPAEAAASSDPYGSTAPYRLPDPHPLPDPHTPSDPHGSPDLHGSPDPHGLSGPHAFSDPYAFPDPYDSPYPYGIRGPDPVPPAPRPAGDEEHQQAREPAPGRPPGVVPLPRRPKHPDPATGRHHPAPAPFPEPSGPAGGRRRRGPAGSPDAGEPHTGGHRRADDPAGSGQPPGFVDGLPRRVRQASLAPQLRDVPESPRVRGHAGEATPGAAGDAEALRDAEAVRSRMASMQRGWQRGRRQNADGTDPAAVRSAGTDTGTSAGRPAPRTTSEGNGP